MKSILENWAFSKSKSGKNLGSIIFLHGPCDTGKGLKSWIKSILGKQFTFKNYSILFPTAPLKNYSLLNNQKLPIWYDQLDLGSKYPEDLPSIDASSKFLNTIIHAEAKIQGIPLSKVIVGGFSMGGSMAMHLAYSKNLKFAGVFSLSSFLGPDSRIFEILSERQKEKEKSKFSSLVQNNNTKCANLPKLFMCNGKDDPLVKYEWGKQTFRKFRDFGVDGYFHTINKGKEHKIYKNELILLHEWIQSILMDDNEFIDTMDPKISASNRKFGKQR